jgi:hypothetical protein
MTVRDLVIFDTSTLPEYYSDVHKIIALPRDYVVTYDYSIRHVAGDVASVLDNFVATNPASKIRVILAYLQPQAYQKGDGSDSVDPIPDPTFATLTRLAEVAAVRKTKNDDGDRYYIDLQLLGYPFDRDRSIAKSIVAKLRSSQALPMRTYIVACPDSSPDALFSQKADDQAFTQVVDTLSSAPSQFSKDTFWRLVRVSFRTKSLVPMKSTAWTDLKPKTDKEADEDKRYSYLAVPDQSTLHFRLQFHKGREEHGVGYRVREISVELTPKAASDLLLNSFQARSFGLEVVAVSVPATSSLSPQEARIALTTKNHEDDARKDYLYGPRLEIAIRYRKAVFRSSLAIVALCIASGLFGWAAFATSVLTAAPTVGYIVPIGCRVVGVVIGVLTTLYAYYLWTDDVALDKARRT